MKVDSEGTAESPEKFLTRPALYAMMSHPRDIGTVRGSETLDEIAM